MADHFLAGRGTDRENVHRTEKISDWSKGVVVEVTKDTSTIGVALSLNGRGGTLMPSVEATAKCLMGRVRTNVVHIDLSNHEKEWTVAGRLEVIRFQYL